MNNSKEIRWKQRFENFEKALKQLDKAVSLYKNKGLNDIEKQGLIQCFEFTFELAWKVIKDYLQAKEVSVKFPREVIKEGFKYEIIQNGDVWMEMLEKRNLLAHTYNESITKIGLELIVKEYHKKITDLYNFLKNQF